MKLSNRDFESPFTDEHLKRNIAYLRNLRKLSMSAMASKVKISVNAYRTLERGDTRIINPAIYRISEALGINIDHLIFFDPNKDQIIPALERANRSDFQLKQAMEVIEEMHQASEVYRKMGQLMMDYSPMTERERQTAARTYEGLESCTLEEAKLLVEQFEILLRLSRRCRNKPRLSEIMKEDHAGE